MKFFAYQRGPKGPEPVVFHDERPVSAAHKRAVIKGTEREVPEELADLPLAELAERMKSKEPPIGMLICDPPPPGRITMLFVKGPISEEAAEQIRAAWNLAMVTGSPIVIDESVIRPVFAGSPGWPDWEFCAA